MVLHVSILRMYIPCNNDRGNEGAAYPPLHFNKHVLRTTLRQMMVEMDTVIGDFNCWSETRKMVLKELIEEEDWEDIETMQHTHEWGNHRCRIDRVPTYEGRRETFEIEEGLGCLSDRSKSGSERGKSGEANDNGLGKSQEVNGGKAGATEGRPRRVIILI